MMAEKKIFLMGQRSLKQITYTDIFNKLVKQHDTSNTIKCKRFNKHE